MPLGSTERLLYCHWDPLSVSFTAPVIHCLRHCRCNPLSISFTAIGMHCVLAVSVYGAPITTSALPWTVKGSCLSFVMTSAAICHTGFCYLSITVIVCACQSHTAVNCCRIANQSFKVTLLHYDH